MGNKKHYVMQFAPELVKPNNCNNLHMYTCKHNTLTDMNMDQYARIMF